MVGGGGDKINIDGAIISLGEDISADVSSNVIIKYNPFAFANLQELKGLNKVSSVDPIVGDWKEY